MVKGKWLGVTPERLARAADDGETPTRRSIKDPFDALRTTRGLAPHDQKLNDIRWLIGESLRRTYKRAQLNDLQSKLLKDKLDSHYGPRSGLPESDLALRARDKMRMAEKQVGPHAWPIVTRIVLNGGGVRDCRGFVPELITPWRADAVISDRLRVALDSIGELMGVTCARDAKRSIGRDVPNQ